MGDDQQGRLGLAQEALQRFARRDVQMVRGLVQQQKIGGRHAEQGQLQTGALAARQL